jgi:hypothetical protein
MYRRCGCAQLAKGRSLESPAMDSASGAERTAERTSESLLTAEPVLTQIKDADCGPVVGIMSRVLARGTRSLPPIT